MTARPKQIEKAKAKPGPGSDEPFTYTTRRGDTFTVPSMSNALNAGEIRRLRNEQPSELAFYIIERDCSKDELAVFDSMSYDELTNDFMAQWNEHSGMDLGNS